MINFKKYGIITLINLALNVIRTKMLFPKARIIRFPADIRGRKFIEISNGFTTGIGCRLEAYPVDNKSKTLIIGKNVQINDYVHITAMQSVKIGDNVLLASKIYISDCTHGFYEGGTNDSSPLEPPQSRKYKMNPVVIEDNVWIGEFVSILPGVTIGKGSIIGANSVVTRNIDENCIAVGSPARIIKKYSFETEKWEKIK